MLSRLAAGGALRRNLRHPLFTATLAVIVIAAVVTVGYLRAGYRRALDEGTIRAAFLARILEEQTLRNFQAADLVLTGAIDTITRAPLPVHDAAFEQSLRDRLKTLSYIRALFVIGPDGFIVQDTDHPHTPRVTLADRDYFRAHKADPNLGLLIGTPLLSRSVNRWFVSVSRRVPAAEGSFGGVAVAAIEPSFYEQAFAELGLGPKDAVTLLHADTTLIARYPQDYDLVGKKLPDLTLFREQLPAAPRGTFESHGVGFPGHRIVSYRALPGMPLVVSVALDRTALLVDWRWRAARAAAVFALCSVLALVTAGLLVERRRVRKEIRRRALLTQKLESLGHMTGGIAHDFKNLIAAVDSSLKLVSRNIHDPEKIERSLAMAAEALERGARLTSQLLTFAKRQKLEIENADANELLRNLEPLLRHAAGPDVRLGFRFADTLPPCRLDQAQFDAALMNLVVNARDAMQEAGAIEVSTDVHEERGIRSSSLKPGAYVHIRVEDDGPGMSSDVMARAFDPFFSTKGDQGTGLGLAQVYAFMHQIGGDVRLAGVPHGGTRVDLYFPAAA